MGRFKKMFAVMLIYFFNCFPVKRNKIFLYSYYGSQYGCNPKYITDYIVNHYPVETFDIVWAFNDPASRSDLTFFRKVKTMSIPYFYELCTAKIIITNCRTTDLFIKRKNQYYIQTWHSSLRLKQIEKDAENMLPADYVRMAKADSMKCDLLLSGCEYSTSIFKKAFWYAGEIFEHGTPRNDVLIPGNANKRDEILAKLGISSNNKVLLYAPTFRQSENTAIYQLEWKRLLENLRNRFGSEWIILVKLHPHLIAKSTSIIDGEHAIDVTSYDDMQELLLIADVLISDYSSLMFDFSITNRPCFLYVPDLETYTKQDRKLYFDLMELPFISATSGHDLLEKIYQFDEIAYKRNVKEFQQRVGSYEQGKASKNLAAHIHAVCFETERSNVHEAI